MEICKTGRCDCMTESTKQKVEFIQVKLVDNKPAIEIMGKVSKEEININRRRIKNTITGYQAYRPKSPKTNLSEGYMQRTIGQSPFLPQGI